MERFYITFPRTLIFGPPIFEHRPKHCAGCSSNNSHEPPIAGNRYLLRYKDERSGSEKTIEANAARGEHALRVMDAHLAQSSWFNGRRFGIADIALYAYTHVAEEGGFDLSPHKHIHHWLDNVRSQPNHILLLQETSALPVTSLEEESLQ